MTETDFVVTLRAPVLLRAPGDSVANGCVVVSRGRVSYAGRWSSRRAEGPVTEFGGALITPGLVNAHTHLHLAHLAGRIPRPRSFAGWLFQMAPRVWRSGERLHRKSVRQGAEACLIAGVTTVGDIFARWEAAREHGRTPLRKVVFLELLGLRPEEAPEVVAKADERLQELEGEGLLTPAIAPHAAYSACQELYRAALQLARRRGCPLSTHVAESQAEQYFLRDGTGELAPRLRALGRLPRRWRPPGLSPVQLLARWGVLRPGTLLVHCNHLSEADVGLVAGSGAVVVYCPRSSDYFHVQEHPWQKLRQRGVVVALGTDSLTSSPSLSVLDEMRFLASRHSGVAPDELLSMGTLAGAQALGLAGQAGALRPGYWADLAVWDLPGIRPRAATGAFIHTADVVRACYVAGRQVWPPLP